MYSINWPEVIRRALPAVLRKVRIIAFLDALISPVVTLGGGFGFFRESIEQELQITPQVRILRYWLNRLFDPADQRIRVLSATDTVPFFIFREDENRPVYLPQFISGSSIDFIVELPRSIRMLESQVRGFVDKYKLPTKRYRILYV